MLQLNSERTGNADFSSIPKLLRESRQWVSQGPDNLLYSIDWNRLDYLGEPIAQPEIVLGGCEATVAGNFASLSDASGFRPVLCPMKGSAFTLLSIPTTEPETIDFIQREIPSEYLYIEQAPDAQHYIVAASSKAFGADAPLHTMPSKYFVKTPVPIFGSVRTTVPAPAQLPSPFDPQSHIASGQSSFNWEFKRLDEVAAEQPFEWAVENIFQERSVNAIYGWSAVGKSFIALDLAAAIAEGREWFGHETKKMDVTYLALEGGDGLRNRINAYKHGRPLPQNVSVYRGKFNLLDKSMVRSFIASRKAARASGGVIFIDTLSKAIPGADENSAKEMTVAVEHAELVKNELDACVVIIHHSTKPNAETGKAGGLRGSGAIQAGIDGVIQVAKRIRKWDGEKYVPLEKDQDYEPTDQRMIVERFLIMDKVKEGEDLMRYPFDLRVEKIGTRTRKDGKVADITSCRVIDQRPEATNSCAAPVSAPQGGTTYSNAERKSFTTKDHDRKPPNARGRRGTGGENGELVGLNYQDAIIEALHKLEDGSDYRNMRGQNGAPQDRAAVPRTELITKIIDCLNADVDPKNKDLHGKIADGLVYAVKRGAIQKTTSRGTQYFWRASTIEAAPTNVVPLTIRS